MLNRKAFAGTDRFMRNKVKVVVYILSYSIHNQELEICNNFRVKPV